MNFRLFCPPEKLVRLSGLLRPRLGRCTPLSPTPLPTLTTLTLLYPPKRVGGYLFTVLRCVAMSAAYIPSCSRGLCKASPVSSKRTLPDKYLATWAGSPGLIFGSTDTLRGALSICMALRADGFSARFIEADHRAPNDTRNERRFCCSFLGDLASRCSLASWTLVSCRSVATVV